MKTFDLAVIGSGSGLMILEAAAVNGMKCAIVEKSKFGGTCLTKGCIPSKMLVYPADMIREAQSAKRIGLSFAAPEIDWDTIARRMWEQINYSGDIERSLDNSDNITVLRGTAEFTGPDTMRVYSTDGKGSPFEFRSARFVIAAGARSFVPPVRGLEDTGYVTSESFFGDKFPARPWNRLVIIGGGAIGAEFAHIFSAFGTKVTVIEVNERILAAEDDDISGFVAKQFMINGIDVMTGAKAVSAEKRPDCKAVTVENRAGRTVIECDEIFVAAGLTSNADLLNTSAAGVETDSRGWIMTDPYLKTSQKNIWAIGDINGKYQFRHKANHEAEILINNLFSGTEKAVNYSAVPWAVFTHPQVAHVGLTEKEAVKNGMKCKTAINNYSEVAGGIAMGFSENDADDGFVKIIVGEDKKILGVHIAGPSASVLVQPFVYLMNSGCECKKISRGIINRMPLLRKLKPVCPESGTFSPISDSMVIHPSLNELTAWVFDKISFE